MKRQYISILILMICLMGCGNKLELKPDSQMVIPKSYQDMVRILDNTAGLNRSLDLAQISADEYIISSEPYWKSLRTSTARNASIWAKDVYQGERLVKDWSSPYTEIYTANNILQILEKQATVTDVERRELQGWALFIRAYNLYSLVSIFSKGYNPATAIHDLGIPLKLNSNIDELVPRSTVEETYKQIIQDATEASMLLPTDIIDNKRNRPSKVASFALLARVLLSMRDYEQAGSFADKALSLYAKLTDFNTLNAITPFSHNSEEIIYFTNLINEYSELTTARTVLSYSINPETIQLYNPSDIRLKVYFQKNADGKYNINRINTIRVSPFTGLATDELYLIRAECLARKGETEQAMSYYNRLLKTRWNPNATGTYKPYFDKIAKNADEALEDILTERRRALIFRGTRWTDLKRLNLEGRKISLSRTIGDQVYYLEPNSSRYVLPIPDDEIAISGIQQNIRE